MVPSQYFLLIGNCGDYDSFARTNFVTRAHVTFFENNCRYCR